MKLEFDNLYEQLNSRQRQAVDAIEGPVMVLAGPGTGKTQVLAMRIANILRETHMDPWNILCLTFTESGVVAMRERLLSIIGSPAYHVRIHTFHSFCNDIIQGHPDVFAQARNWQMLGDIERIDLFRSIIDKLPVTSPLKPFGDPYLFLSSIADRIRKLKQEDISPDRFKAILSKIDKFVTSSEEKTDAFINIKANERTAQDCEAIIATLKQSAEEAKIPPALMHVVDNKYRLFTQRLDEAENKRDQGKAGTAFKNDIKKWFDKLKRDLPKQQDIYTIYRFYQQGLKANGRYDYEDMIISVINKFKENDELLAQYQEQFQYILVDEYQDTNGAQNEIVYLLGSFDASPNVFVVGDDKQSIYRFQGASVNNMLEFYEKYQQTVKIVSLRKNYRSQPVVLKAAQEVISRNEASLSKIIPGITDELIPAAGRASEELHKVSFTSEDAEDYFIATRARKLIDQGVEPSEIAVLFRYNRDGAEVMRLMQVAGVPARLEAGENALEDITVKNWINVLRYIAHPEEDELLAYIIQYDWWQLPALETLRIIRHASVKRKPLLDLLSDKDELKNAGISNSEPFQKIAVNMAKWRKDSMNTTLQNLFHTMLVESGWIEYILDTDDHLPALQKMTTLLGKLKELNQADPDMGIEEFIGSLKLLQEHGIAVETSPWQVADRAVRLMTAHKAKGLEFEHVFISRLNDKHWGNNPEPNKVSLPAGLIRHDLTVGQDNNEDERRLFYVALTRAKQNLTLTRAKHKANARPTVPSLFLEELPDDILKTDEVTETPTESVQRIAGGMLKPIPTIKTGEMEDWMRNVLKAHVLSVTHINNYLECPRKFYIKNVLQIPAARSHFQALGTAVHGALDDFFRKYSQTDSLPTEKELFTFLDFYVSRELLTSQERKDIYDQGMVILGNYYSRYMDEFNNKVLGEYDFKHHGVNVDGIPLTGKIDKIELLDPKTSGDKWPKGAKVNVVDYKTGNPDRGLRKLKQGESYYRQLVFYKLLCDLSPQFPYTMVSGEIDFVQPSEKKGYIKKRVAIADADIAELKDTIRTVWQEIQELKFLHDGAACGDCDECQKEF